MDKIEKLVWTDDGINSFEEVIQHIAHDSPYYASDFARKILFSIEKLNIFPQIGRVVPEYSDPDLRELIYQNYRVVYKISRNIIYIVLVIHGSRELPKNI